MTRRTRTKLRRAFAVITVTLLFAGFQNCGVMGRSSVRDSSSDKAADGGGTDGKLAGSYISFGICDGDVLVKNSMVLASDGSSARILVQNCRPLAQPIVVNASELQFIGTGTFIYGQEIYDLHMLTGTQKVTLQVCQAAGNPAIQTRIWKNLSAQQSTYFGSIRLGTSGSGDLLVQTPSSSEPTRYVTQAGQSSQFNMFVTGSSASITYSFNGGAEHSVNNLACLDQSSPVIDDGSGTAPAGTPQSLSMLNGYQVRPSWKVAGVDYAVGYPSSTVLKNPALINMPGVSVDTANRLIRVTGNNVTLDAYDFSRGDFGVYIIGADNTKITNSKFSGTTIMTDADSANLIVSNCIIDGGGTTDSNGFVFMLGQGQITLEYNWIRDFPGRILVNDNGNAVTMRYNLIEDSFGNAGFNYLYFSGGRTYAPIRVLFNTVYQTRQTGSNSAFGFVLDGMPGSTVTAEFAYNTMVTVPNGQSVAIGTLVQASTPGTVTAAWLHHNYVDSRGAGAVFSSDPTAGTTNFYSNNFEMNSGAALPTP